MSCHRNYLTPAQYYQVGSVLAHFNHIIDYTVCYSCEVVNFAELSLASQAPSPLSSRQY